MQPLQKKNAPPSKNETELKKTLDDVASQSLVLHTQTVSKHEEKPKEKALPKSRRNRDSDAANAQHAKFIDSGNKLANKCATVFHYLQQLYNKTRHLEKDSFEKETNAVHHLRDFGLYFDLKAAGKPHVKLPENIHDVIDFKQKTIVPEYAPFVYVIPMISKGHFTLEDQLASSKLESNNICTARDFITLLDEISNLSFARNENNQYEYPRYIYGSQQLFNQCLSAYGYSKSDSKPPAKVMAKAIEALRTIKLAAYHKIYPFTDQAYTFHASGSSNDASASSSDAASASDEFSPADGIENASKANSAIKTNSLPDRTSSDSLATSEQSMSTSNNNSNSSNSKSTISSLTSAPRDIDFMSTEDLEAVVQKRKAAEQAKEEADNSAHLTQLKTMPDHLIENFLRNKRIQQQQAALNAAAQAAVTSSSSAPSASSDS